MPQLDGLNDDEKHFEKHLDSAGSKLNSKATASLHKFEQASELSRQARLRVRKPRAAREAKERRHGRSNSLQQREA